MLNGVLRLPAQLSALVVLTHAGQLPAARDDALSVILQHAGIGTLRLDLLTGGEGQQTERARNVPLLARRLLDGLSLLKRRMRLGEVPTLPIALCAAGDCSPVVLRVAAERDRDIYAVVCRGGLIDLAGTLYLRSLRSPLLVLVAEDDERVATSNRRALREVSCRHELRLLPAGVDAPDAAAASEQVARETALWLVKHLPAPSGSLAVDRCETGN
ncbi:MAG: hypothetical protein V5B07_08595 [Candidatus Accumulibacter sp. UW27]